ncbi:tol-pal system YbgF family protein, partial [Candidatus Latescibacterota bacterium]
MAHYYLGLCYYNGRRFDESLEIFTAFARKYPNSEFTPEAIYFYSDSNYNLGNLEDCIEGFDIVIARYPSHERAEEALYTKAWALMDLGRDEDAITSLLQLIDKYPNSSYTPSSLFSIADYYYNEQRFQEAMDNYQKVVERYPDSEVAQEVPETITELGETIAYIEYEKAIVLFDQARDMDDDTLRRQAAEMLEKVAIDYPGTESEIGAYSNAGMIYEELNEWRKAAEMYDNVIRIFEE